MRDLRNHTREIIERAQSEPVTITDHGVPIAVISALTPATGWDVDAWIEQVTDVDFKPYDSGLADEIADARRQEQDEPDATLRLGLT